MSANPLTADVTIPSDLAEARLLQSQIEEALHATAYSEHEIFAIRLALEEALVNAIKHGNQLDPDKSVQVSYQVTAERFDVRIVDEGPGFNPEDVPDPTLPENLEKGCGRGVFLIREFMNEVSYHGRGNVVTMSKLRNGKPSD